MLECLTIFNKAEAIFYSDNKDIKVSREINPSCDSKQNCLEPNKIVKSKFGHDFDLIQLLYSFDVCWSIGYCFRNLSTSLSNNLWSSGELRRWSPVLRMIKSTSSVANLSISSWLASTGTSASWNIWRMKTMYKWQFENILISQYV